jgi:hypothetical protein
MSANVDLAVLIWRCFFVSLAVEVTDEAREFFLAGGGFSRCYGVVLVGFSRAEHMALVLVPVIFGRNGGPSSTSIVEAFLCSTVRARRL